MDKSYYAIIPASVRYDRKITANAKLLYGEITALCNEKGYCWASNKYFADLYGVSTKTISLWIKSLSSCGYIKSTIKYKEGSKEVKGRYLQLCNSSPAPSPQKCNDPPHKNVGTSPQKCNDPPHKNVKDNNTINITNNNTINREGTKRKRFVPPTIEEAREYFLSKESTEKSADKFFYHYSSVDWYVGKKKMKNWKMAASGWISRDYDNAKIQKQKRTPEEIAEEFRLKAIGEFNG